MTNTQIEMSEDEFEVRYQLLTNHLNPQATWAFGEGRGCLFETCGKELEFVRQQDPGTVWTLVDGDDGDQYLVNGFHIVNRIGYLISTVPIPEGVDIVVRIPMQAPPSTCLASTSPARSSPINRSGKIASDYLGIPTLDTKGSETHRISTA